VELDQHSNSDGGTGVGPAAATATASAARRNAARDQNRPSGLDSNLMTLLDFKKTLIDEQRRGEERIQEINMNIESAKKQIDDDRVQLEEMRVKLKETNEQKETELTRYTEAKNTFIEARNRMKSLEEKSGSSVASRSRKERYDISKLTRSLDQIEHDIQTKKLSKEEERKLVARSKEVATRLYSLKAMHKKEDDYRNMSSQYELLRNKMNKIFDQRSEFGNKIGDLKANLDSLLNLRESLYQDRRAVIRAVREAKAKLDMVETQLNAIQFRKSRQQAAESKQKRQPHQRRQPRDNEERRESMQERAKRNKENQERWNIMKEAALKKMSNGEKLTFDEMKLIYGEGNSID
jgi:uncharacterized coiled-coil DUF342 family protein